MLLGALGKSPSNIEIVAKHYSSNFIHSVLSMIGDDVKLRASAKIGMRDAEQGHLAILQRYQPKKISTAAFSETMRGVFNNMRNNRSKCGNDDDVHAAIHRMYAKLPKHMMKGDIGTAIYYRSNDIEYAMNVMDEFETDEKQLTSSHTIIDALTAYPLIGVNARGYVPILIRPRGKNAFDDIITASQYDDTSVDTPVAELEPPEMRKGEEVAAFDVDEYI
jgi:hypothetical protein